MFALIPRDDYRRALRLRRQLMAVYSYLIVWAGVLLGLELGLFQRTIPHVPLFGLLLLFNLLFHVLIRSGYSERWKDPAMTAQQMAVGVIFITALLYFTHELRGALLSIYFMIMTFAVFGLTRGQMILMSLFVLFCFITMVALQAWLEPGSLIPSMAFGHVSILALGLFWFVYVGGYIRNLQHRVRRQRGILQEQRSELADANARLEQAMEKMEQLVIQDQLTGLFSRHHFLGRLSEELARAERTGHRFHLALIDLDHFKAINDSYGHNAGDEVLRRFALIAAESVRRSDLLARYGGEEFIILFPEGDIDDITTVVERLRAAFGEYQYGAELGNQQVTLSAGIAASREGDSVDTITERADRALYQAKEKGRNRIELAPAD